MDLIINNYNYTLYLYNDIFTNKRYIIYCILRSIVKSKTFTSSNRIKLVVI